MKQDFFEYYAFISYSHADEKWAKWVQRKLETYRFPSTLRKNNESLPKKIFPVFRDQTDMESGELWENLKNSLEKSEYLIVICSPNSAKSKYVNQEVEYFRSLNRNQQIIPFIVDGSPFAADMGQECFCPALKNEKEELLGVSVKELGKKKSVLRLIAAITRLRFDTLVRREKARQRKRTVAGVAILTAMLIAFTGGYKILIGSEHSQQYAQTSLTALENGQIMDAVTYGKMCVKELIWAKEDSQGIVALRSALATKELNDALKVHKDFSIDTTDKAYSWLGNAFDSSDIYLFSDGYVEVYDKESGHLAERKRIHGDTDNYREIGERLNWDPDEMNEHYFSVPSVRNETSDAYSVEQDGNDIVLKGETGTYRFADKADGMKCYAFNYDSTVFAVYNENTATILIANLASGSENEIRGGFSDIPYITLSKNGGLLGVPFRYESDDEYEYIFLETQSGKRVGRFSEKSVTFTRDMDEFFLVEENGKLYKYGFGDITPLGGASQEKKEKEQDVHKIFQHVSPTSFKNDIVISKDGQVVFTTIEEPNHEVYCFDIDCVFYKAGNGEVLYHYSDQSDFGSIEKNRLDFNEDLTACITCKGELIHIRNGKPFYTIKHQALKHVAMNKEGTKAAAVDEKHNVYLFSISGDTVSEKCIFNCKKVIEGYTDSAEITFFGVSDNYIVIATDSSLFYYDLANNSIYQEQSSAKYTNPVHPSGSFEKDGLFILSPAEGSNCVIIDPKTHEDVTPIQVTNDLWDYSEKTHLFCCSATEDMHGGKMEYIIFKYNKGKFKKICQYSSEYDVTPQFSDTGKYLIFNYLDIAWEDLNEGPHSVVIDAFTAKELCFIPDRIIHIVNNTIYDIYFYYFPASLPMAKWYSVQEFKKIAKQ